MSEYDRVRNAYGEKYPRLQQIKATYDPNNLFHLETSTSLAAEA
jgi:FAD/FMN-containing dehydrogenase